VTKIASIFAVSGAVMAAAAVAPLRATGGLQASGGTARPSVGPDRSFTVSARSVDTLPNGLKVVIVRAPSIPKVSLVLTVLTGLAADKPDAPGVASMTADAIQEGTKTRTSREIRRTAFGMGANLSASVAQDFTAVSLRGLSEYAPNLIDLLSDVVLNPSFPQSEIDILKANELQGLQQQKSSPQYLSQRSFRKALFGPHPYARISPTPESVKAIDRSALVTFYDTYYRPNNAFLLVVGDVESAPIRESARKAFGGWTRKDIAPAAMPAAPALSGRHLVFVERPGSVQSSISLGNIGIKRTDPSWYNLSVANTVYGGAFNSRIVRNIREDKGYSYSPFSQFAAFKYSGFYRFAADVRNDVTGATLKEVYGETDKLRAEGAAGEELDNVKRYLKGVFVIATSSQGGLTNALNNIYAFGLPSDYLETYQQKISAVTTADVKSGAQTLFGSSDSLVVIVGDYAKVKDQLTGFVDTTFEDLDGKTIPAPGTN
jgi:zinc protease